MRIELSELGVVYDESQVRMDDDDTGGTPRPPTPPTPPGPPGPPEVPPGWRR